jgi:RNA polymerase sigma-70 factor (ECF subfamily)
MKHIIEEYQGVVKAVIKKFLGSYNEDVEQEVYIKAWRNMESYQEKGRLKSWMATIAANVCRDYFKSAAYRQKQCEVSDEVLENRGIRAPQERIVDAKARQKIILKAIHNLPSKMRKVIILFEFEDLTLAQIAHKLGEPEGTIKSRLYNARQILAKELQFLQGDEQ